MSIFREIKKIREHYGIKLLILAHHYQRDAVVQHADTRGDSFQLAKYASEQEQAKYIVFCGVRFMVEAAEVLSKPHQKVLHPNPESGCPLADMADLPSVEKAWEFLNNVADVSKIIPVVYVNSDVKLKAFCGNHNGLTCTSSNAPKAFNWAFNHVNGNKVFFFPDQFLGTNTAHKMGISDNEIAVFDPKQENGGVSQEQIEKARIILWRGFCHVHTHFKPEHLKQARAEYPGIKIYVHPECKSDVVALADGFGSTKFLREVVQDGKPGEIFGIGTEYNLVNRLAAENPDKIVVPMIESMCPNMFKITEENLHETLKNLETVKPVNVEEKYKQGALLALNRMLTLQ
ncbi:MAG: quinolinate synthase NadA [Planctomycetes bacterium]|nr:quinolinate synthase NadA [Planctomycetota bacterium]